MDRAFEIAQAKFRAEKAAKIEEEAERARAYDSEAYNEQVREAGRKRLERQEREKEEASIPNQVGDYSTLTDEELGIVPLVDVQERPIQWLWPYRLEIGGLALMAGDAGIGKSQVLLKAAAVVSTGGEWPGGEGRAAKGNVVIVSAEDRPDRTIKPRLRAMGSNIERITIVKAKVFSKVKGKDGKPTNVISFKTFQDLAYWAAVFDRIGGVSLFIADPLPSYLGRNVNDSKNMEIRAVMEPFLDEVIWPRDICMWGNTHLNKSSDSNAPLHRVTGSVAYGALPRNVHFIVRDDENPLRRYFKQAKCNDAPDDLPALPFQVEIRHVPLPSGEVIETAIPVFEEQGVQIDLASAMAPKSRRKESLDRERELSEWFLSQLKDGWVESDEIKDRARKAGFGKDMIWKVKGQLGVKASKDGMTGKWYWSLPCPDASDASGA